MLLECLVASACAEACSLMRRRWLSIEAPTPEDKIACLTEIAQEHGVDWAPDGAAGPPGAKAYLSGDRTSYSDPLTPPSGGWGGNSGVWFLPSAAQPNAAYCQQLPHFQA
jgi:hypothetical protein